MPSRKRVVDFYEKRFDEFGYDPRSVGWGDKESQELRFQVLTEVDDLNGACICDLGCGFGDLYGYLQKHEKRIDYHGIDISPKLIEEAKARYPQASFEVLDILEKTPSKRFDYVLSSGMLSFKMDNHLEYVQQTVRRMFEITKKAVAVNFLSSYVDYELEKNFHFSPEEALTFGKSLTPYVALRHDYPLYEFTLYLYHEPRVNHGPKK